jgi:pimeloyl-ACP methyl ester carboxylesterase
MSLGLAAGPSAHGTTWAIGKTEWGKPTGAALSSKARGERNGSSRFGFPAYRVIAPDLPGFGLTAVPEQRHYKYTFDALANTILAFTDALYLTRYVLYVFDYGAPTGFRLAMARPERISAIVSQNGNAYEEGWATHGLPEAYRGDRFRHAAASLEDCWLERRLGGGARNHRNRTA